MESSWCPFLLVNAKQGIEPRSSFLVTDTRSLIGRTLCFFVRKVGKNSHSNYQKDNTFSRDAQSDPNLTETTKNNNKSVISVIQFSIILWPPTEYAVKLLRS